MRQIRYILEISDGYNKDKMRIIHIKILDVFLEVLDGQDNKEFNYHSDYSVE